MSNKIKLALTGGHMSPALSIIEKLPEDYEVVYIGRKYALEGDRAESLEYRKITDLGLKFIDLKTGRLQRRLSRHTLSSLIKTVSGLRQAKNILTTERPDCVLGFGGYLSLPVCIAAYMLKIPIVIHEQTLGAGLANKIIGKYFATKICISFESTRKYFPDNKVVLTGNPIRTDVLHPIVNSSLFVNLPGKKPLIFITGGSLGSHIINETVARSIEKILDNFEVIHQTGDAKEFNDYERLEELRRNLPKDKIQSYVLFRFIDPKDFGAILKKADLVIGRSGINTVTELLYLRKKAVLIPLSIGQKNEQKTNAIFAREQLGVEIIDQKDLSADTLLRSIDRQIKKETQEESQKKTSLGENAADKIIQQVSLYAKKATNQ